MEAVGVRAIKNDRGNLAAGRRSRRLHKRVARCRSLRADLVDKLNLDLRTEFASFNEALKFSIVLFEIDGPYTKDGTTDYKDDNKADETVATDAT